MNEPITLLLAENSSDSKIALEAFLKRSGFHLARAKSVLDALTVVQNSQVDFVVATISLPHLNGRELVRKLRASNNWIPVLLIAETVEQGEKAIAIDEGADDFLTIPFEAQELVSRIRAVLRRVASDNVQKQVSKICIGQLELDRISRRVYVDGQEVCLTPKAIALLEYLMLNANQIVTREQLLNYLWGWEKIVTSRAVDTRIAELRRVLHGSKSGSQYIETVSGFGYRFIGIIKKS